MSEEETWKQLIITLLAANSCHPLVPNSMNGIAYRIQQQWSGMSRRKRHVAKHKPGNTYFGAMDVCHHRTGTVRLW